MFAVIQTGGKQYKVESSQTLLVNKLPGSAGETIQFDQILLLGGEGAPQSMDGAMVSAEIIDQVKGEKVIIFKKKRRHTYRRKNGHRQQLTLLRITEIAQGGKVLAKAEPKAAKAAAPAMTNANGDEPVQATTGKTAAPKKAAKIETPGAMPEQAPEAGAAAKKAKAAKEPKETAAKKPASKKE